MLSSLYPGSRRRVNCKNGGERGVARPPALTLRHHGPLYAAGRAAFLPREPGALAAG